MRRKGECRQCGLPQVVSDDHSVYCAWHPSNRKKKETTVPKKEAETVQPATDGLKFKMKVYERGDYVEREFTVGKKCEANRGQWVCTTHGKAFDNQMAKDSHIDDGKHTLAWHCFEHGPEVP